MDTPFEISKWRDTFETHESRKYKTLQWVSVPISLGYGYEAMLAEFGDETAAIYGAWILMTTIAATAPNRGVLADSRNRPYSADFLARKTGIPADYFRRLIAWASTDEVAWLVPFTGRPPGDDRENTGSPSEPPTLVVDEATRPTSVPADPKPPRPDPIAHPPNVTYIAKSYQSEENPTISNTGRSPGDHREESGRTPADQPGLHNITSPNITSPNLTKPNNTSSINQSNPDNRNSEGPVPVPRPVQDRIDRLMDDLTFRGEVVELANKLRTGRIHRHPFWKTATREDLWRIVFVGQAFGPECLGECIRKIAAGGIEKPGRYIDASFRKMLHEHHGVSWEQLRNHIPVPAPPRPEPVST
jgi:hypothetical protein